MRDPHVRFCERRGGVIPRAYSTAVGPRAIARLVLDRSEPAGILDEIEKDRFSA
jgi:hypothetical protein